MTEANARSEKSIRPEHRSIRRQRPIAELFLALVLVLLGLAGCGSDLGSATPSHCLPAPLHLSTSQVHAGGTVVLSAGPFACDGSYPPGKTYSLTLQQGGGVPLALGSVPVHQNGAFSTRVHIPTAASPGLSFLQITGSTFDNCAKLPNVSCAGYFVNLDVLPPT